ncbi:MAG: acetyl-CoA carboxylase biotin carboxyl carrier protein [Planctomycetota bacterium]
MIDIRKLKELVRLMVANELTELVLRDSEEEVTLRRPSAHQAVAAAPAAAPVVQHAVAATPAVVETPAAKADAPTEDVNVSLIESPMVGTYYSAPNPDSSPFINVGDRVSPDTVICIIEAMKIFNEIKAETSGTVHKVCVQNGDSVEFGQPLFEIKPD